MALNDSAILQGLKSFLPATRQPTGAAADPPRVAPQTAVSPAADAPRAWRPIDEEDQTAAVYAKGAGSFKDRTDQSDPTDPAPPSSAAVKAIAKKPLSQAAVVEEYRKADLRPLWLGKISYSWIAQQPDRAQALKNLKSALVLNDLATAAARVDRYIHIYWVAQLLGVDEAQSLRVAALRELCRLVARNAADETYALRKTCEAATRQLWRRMVRERMSAAAVRSEVLKIRPSRSIRLDGRKGRLAKMLREVRQCPVADLLPLLQAIQNRLAASGMDAGRAA